MLVISASYGDVSINNKVWDGVQKKLAEHEVSFDTLYLKNYTNIPLYLGSDEAMPEQIKEIHNIIQQHKHIVIFAPEHNGYVSAFFKNIIDWVSRISSVFLTGKAVQVISVSPTNKVHRTMTEGIKNTLYRLEAVSCDFINFNQYTEEVLTSHRIDDLTDLIVNFSKSY